VEPHLRSYKLEPRRGKCRAPHGPSSDPPQRANPAARTSKRYRRPRPSFRCGLFGAGSRRERGGIARCTDLHRSIRAKCSGCAGPEGRAGGARGPARRARGGQDKHGSLCSEGPTHSSRQIAGDKAGDRCQTASGQCQASSFFEPQKNDQKNPKNLTKNKEDDAMWTDGAGRAKSRCRPCAAEGVTHTLRPRQRGGYSRSQGRREGGEPHLV